MFLFKKIAGALLAPVPICLELALLGALLLLSPVYRRMGKALLWLAFLLFILFSTNPFPYFLMKPLVTRYPPLLNPPGRRVATIVVLGGDYHPVPGLPITSQLGPGAMGRVSEGVRLQKLLPGSKLVVSGGSVHGYATPQAETMSRFAQLMGVPASAIVMEAKSVDTEEEAQLLAPRLGRQPFILVTSAAHMPRAMMLFLAAGTNPIAAPVGYHGLPGFFADYFPGAQGLGESEEALHEYQGLAWLKLKELMAN